MADRTCSIEGCERRHSSGGLCESHGRRLQRYGDPLAGPPIRQYARSGVRAVTVEDRFWSKVDIPANPLDCWTWTAALSQGTGYGVLQVESKRRGYAHRISYELSMGTIGQGLEIDHLCRNRQCVNPLHLQAVPASVNVRRTPRTSVTHCPQGHPYSGDNLYEWNGHRQCRTCLRERARARKVA